MVGAGWEAARQALLAHVKVLIVATFDYRNIDWENLDPHTEEQPWRLIFFFRIKLEEFFYTHLAEYNSVRRADTPKLDISSWYNVEVASDMVPRGKSDHVMVGLKWKVSEEMIKNDKAIKEEPWPREQIYGDKNVRS